VHQQKKRPTTTSYRRPVWDVVQTSVTYVVRTSLIDVLHDVVTTSWGVHASTSYDVGARRRRDQCMTSSRRRQDVEFFDGNLISSIFSQQPLTIAHFQSQSELVMKSCKLFLAVWLGKPATSKISETTL